MAKKAKKTKKVAAEKPAEASAAEEVAEKVAGEPAKPEKKVVKKKRTRRKTKTAEEVWQELKDGISADSPEPYAMSKSFEANTAIAHPKFGVGVVTESLALKIEVAFQEGPKSLVHNRK